MRVLTPHDQQRSGWFLAIHLASLFLGLDGQYGVPFIPLKVRQTMFRRGTTNKPRNVVIVFDMLHGDSDQNHSPAEIHAVCVTAVLQKKLGTASRQPARPSS